MKLQYARASALPAIAAVLALSSTPLLAQQTQPVPDASTPAAPAETPAPAPAPAPVTSSVPTSDTSSPAASPTDTATATDTTTTRHAPRSVRHVTHVAAKPAKMTAHIVTHTATAHLSAPAVKAVKTAAATRVSAPPPPAPPSSAMSQSSVKPVVDLSATPRPAPKPMARATSHDETLPIAAGGVLALLAIGGAAAAMTRRRRSREEEWAEDESMAYEPVEPAASDEPIEHSIIDEEQPAVLAPAASAFAWGNPKSAEEAPAQEPMVEDERRPGETWVERAYRGPSASNPSVSLKTRLRRAAFFDKREREAAAGLAEPLDTSAGLPAGRARSEERELA